MSTVNIPVTPQLQLLAGAITTQENAPAYLNNPCALVYAGQPGASPSGLASGLAEFDNLTDGQNACFNQLNLYAQGTCGQCQGQPQTIEGMTSIYCPASIPGCDPTTYANNLAAALGVSTDTLVSDAISGDGSTDQSVSDDGSLFGSFDQTVTIAGLDVPYWGLAIGAVALLGALMYATRS